MGIKKKKNLNKLFTKYKDIRGFKYIWNMKSFKRIFLHKISIKKFLKQKNYIDHLSILLSLKLKKTLEINLNF
jgi:hypothetical protein